ncbi:MAG: neuraminidase (sialidase) [Planctomycetes bacterium]|nr:neuraminidase (sialidase) [Planctomycetota bacterium]
MFIFEKAPFPSCHASTIVEVAAGRFLAAWFGGKAEGAADVKIWQSHFDGKAWTPPVVAAEEPGFPCWNPVLFRSRAGTLSLFYKAGRSPERWSGYVRRSRDGGKTWGDVEQFPAGLLGPIKNKPIQRKDGTILAGSSVESHRAWTSWVERSTDDGRTWQRFGPIAVPKHPHGIIQPTLLECADGRILALCRSRGLGAIAQAESKDGGRTWSAATATTLPNPNSGIDAVRAADGAFYLIYNHTRLGRFPLNLARSTDNGKSWQMVHVFEEQPGEFSYPAIIQSRDGRLHATYTFNRRHIKHVPLDPAKLTPLKRPKS